RPVDVEPGIVPPAPELVGWIELVADRVDVHRALRVEVEAVRDADRDDERRRPSRVELDACAEALAGRVGSEIVQPDRGATDREREIVGVADVYMDASEDVRVRRHRVP